MGWWRNVVARGAVALAVAGGGVSGAAAVEPVPVERICAVETARVEAAQRMPERLLHAISVVESGRYDAGSRATVAWPWTVTAEGQGRYFPTKAEAVAEVRRLKARGVANIDVGCMQVNLKYHPQAFHSLEEAFDPQSNVEYAARFLQGLYQATDHWPTAASYYHSQTPHLAAAYRQRLEKIWSAPPTALASARSPKAPAVQPVAPSSNQLRPVPSSPQVDALRRAWQQQQASGRDEARRIADAYRQARLLEYQMRRANMIQTRARVAER